MAEKTPMRPKKSKKKSVEQAPPIETGVDIVTAALNESATLSTEDQALLDEMMLDPISEYEKEYMQDESKPLHTNFVVPNKGKKNSCPVFFGTVEEKTRVVECLCQQMNPKTLKLWGTLSCYCDDVPKMKLSKTEKNPNRVFICCPKPQDLKCRFFQWIDQAPLPKKTCNAKAIKKRFLEMAEEQTIAKRGKEANGGFYFHPDVITNNIDTTNLVMEEQKKGRKQDMYVPGCYKRDQAGNKIYPDKLTKAVTDVTCYDNDVPCPLYDGIYY